VSPIDYLCRDCGASFEIGVSSLLSDDYRPDCPTCDSNDVGTDWDAVVRRFGDTPSLDKEPHAAVPSTVREAGR
jgi:DNA-directed RNA polymerase subunit RPC12/RpoP